MKKPTLSQSVSNYIDRDFKESKKFRVWTLLFLPLLPFHRENKLLKGFSRWKIVRINLLMADSLEGINRLRKSCSAHAKNCGRISEIVSWLAPRARELSIPFCSGARTKWREHESSRVKRLGRSSYANPRCLNMKFSTWNPCIGFHLLFQITC